MSCFPKGGARFSEPMDPVKRVTTALLCRQPDRVPKGELDVHPGVVRTLLTFPADAPVDVEARALALDLLEMDLVCIQPAPPGDRSDPFPPATPAALQEIREWSRRFPYYVFAFVGGGFSHLVYALGFEEFLCHHYHDRAEFGAWIKRAVAYNTDLALRCLEHGAHGVVVAEDLAHDRGLLISPQVARDVLFPALSRQAEAINRAGGIAVFHSDGRITPLLGDIAEAGFRGVHSLQPSASVDLAAVKRDWGHRLCLMGNIELEDTMNLDSPARVREVVREAVMTAGPGGGFILSTSSGFLRPETPLAHILAMYRAGTDFGRYPLPEG